MDEIKRSVEYSVKRSQALRNCESHIASILWKAAQDIVSKSSKYRNAGRLTNESSLLSDARKITAEAESEIESYISAYSKASCKILGLENSNSIECFLQGEIYGKTTSERNATYLANFAEDIVRMIKAGTLMDYTDSQILSAIRTGYKDPYKASVVTKAQRKDINIATPSYGKGYYRNAYQNLVRNAKQVISIAWGRAEQEYGKESGAIGYQVFRGSSFPCQTCDDLCGYVHSLDTMVIPAHVSCVCRAEFIFKDNKNE